MTVALSIQNGVPRGSEKKKENSVERKKLNIEENGEKMTGKNAVKGRFFV